MTRSLLRKMLLIKLKSTQMYAVCKCLMCNYIPDIYSLLRVSCRVSRGKQTYPQSRFGFGDYRFTI